MATDDAPPTKDRVVTLDELGRGRVTGGAMGISPRSSLTISSEASCLAASGDCG